MAFGFWKTATAVIKPDRVVLKTKTKLYFYRRWCGISYFQNYYSIPNPIHLPLHDIISI
jgi:hypothetical protein